GRPPSCPPGALLVLHEDGLLDATGPDQRLDVAPEVPDGSRFALLPGPLDRGPDAAHVQHELVAPEHVVRVLPLLAGRVETVHDGVALPDGLAGARLALLDGPREAVPESGQVDVAPGPINRVLRVVVDA